MPYEPNERLAYEAVVKRDGMRKTPYITDKGVREMSALFALRASIERGEQPDGTSAMANCGVLANDVEKLIPRMPERTIDQTNVIDVKSREREI